METSFNMAYKVFMADSSASAIKVVHMALQGSGVEFYTAQDGSKAIEIIQKINPDAIILALSLPGKDGYELAIDLARQAQFKATPLLLVRGVFEELDEERIKELEYAEIIQKPFDSEELVNKVQTLIGQALDPDTFPEEPEAVQAGREEKREDIPTSQVVAEVEDRLEKKMKQEILGLERELEKRIVSRVKAEILADIRHMALDREAQSQRLQGDKSVIDD